jgi:hypothetical protein
MKTGCEVDILFLMAFHWQVGAAGCHAIAPKLRPGLFRKGQRVFKPGDTCEILFVNKGVVAVTGGEQDTQLVQGDYYGSVRPCLFRQPARPPRPVRPVQSVRLVQDLSVRVSG